jgi:hypothetical protein
VSNGHAGKCCPNHHADEQAKCCKHCPMKQEHRPLPVWQSMQGQRYCDRYSEHGEWVLWPCEGAQ